MLLFIGKRLLQAIPLLVVISLISFAILHLAPGDPAITLYGTEASQEELAQVRASWGLDQPIHVQYVKWLWNTLHGNLGRSYADGRPVIEVISDRIPATLTLTGTAFLVALLAGVGIGILSATRSHSIWDYVGTLFSTTAYSVPTFWLGLLCILLFSAQLGWLPSAGTEPIRGASNLFDRLPYLVMPAFILSLREMGRLIRFTRASMLDVLGQDYIRTAFSKGLSGQAVAVGHALRNALIPIITLLGLSLPGIISGSVVVESVFAWPGMGRLIVEAAFQRNYAILMGDIILVGVLVILGNLLADVAYGIVDPRIRYR